MARRGRSGTPLLGLGGSSIGYWLVVALVVLFIAAIVAAQVSYGIECSGAGGEVVRGIGFEKYNPKCLRDGQVIEL